MLRFTTTFTDSAGGGTKYNNLYFQATSGADALACKEQVVDFWTSLEPYMHTGLDWALDPLVPAINEATGEVVDIYNVGAAASSGESVSEPLPLSSQIMVRLGTNGIVNNRRVAGRIYIPGVTVTANDAGHVDPATVSAIAAIAAAAFDGGVNEALAVWSRPATGRAGSLHTVAALSVWSEFAVLRSRRD